MEEKLIGLKIKLVRDHNTKNKEKKLIMGATIENDLRQGGLWRWADTTYIVMMVVRGSDRRPIERCGW